MKYTGFILGFWKKIRSGLSSQGLLDKTSRNAFIFTVKKPILNHEITCARVQVEMGNIPSICEWDKKWKLW